jgi:Holliday junction DNA helicase RuvA
MIAWVKGEILEMDENEVVVNANGVGYSVFLGRDQIEKMSLKVGAMAEIVIYTAVREDEIKLFGFESFMSRNLFTLLLSVNGVGPKAAMNIVNQMDSSQMIATVLTGDFFPFTRVSGIGKKTAQKIILELQGKVEKLDFPGVESPTGSTERKTGAAERKNERLTGVGLRRDAKSALSNLGFRERDVEAVIRRHTREEETLDSIIRKCLADLRKQGI